MGFGFGRDGGVYVTEKGETGHSGTTARESPSTAAGGDERDPEE